MAQVKRTFDPETKRKVSKSFLLYGIPTAVSTGITAYLKTGNLTTAVLVGILGLTGSILNVGVQYNKGIPKDK
uniref:Uncharacterized protein n=1 Tax=viral metagenome TaxID=1070528 RepID=A0A6M3IKF7_9ZZZZ